LSKYSAVYLEEGMTLANYGQPKIDLPFLIAQRYFSLVYQIQGNIRLKLLKLSSDIAVYSNPR
jgi:hypothetical protein